MLIKKTVILNLSFSWNFRYRSNPLYTTKSCLSYPFKTHALI